ncbi:MAG: zinc-binding dehydrogenase [Gemmatimonadota bacterium]
MRAAFFRRHGDPEVIELGEAPEPAVASGSVVVEVRAAALNHLDLWVRRGIPGLELQLPHIGGSDVAGIVAEVGPDAGAWTPGDRVIVNPGLSCGACEWCGRGEESLCRDYRILGEHVAGGFAERVRVPAGNLLLLPEGLAFEEAAAVPLVFQTAWRALKGRARLEEGETVLVTGGSGGVSTAAVQIGKLLRATVIAVTSGAENAARLRALGADEVVDRQTASFPDEVSAITGGRGVDVVLDSVGEATWKDCLRSLARGGRLVTYGATTGPGAALDLRHVFWKQLAVLGSTMASRAEFEEVMGHVFEGRLRAVVADVLALEEARTAHERLERGDAFGKLVLTP